MGTSWKTATPPGCARWDTPLPFYWIMTGEERDNVAVDAGKLLGEG